MPPASRLGDEHRWVCLWRSTDQSWSLVRDKSAPAEGGILLVVVGLHFETLRKQRRARYHHDLPSVRFPLVFQHLIPTILENPSARLNYRTPRIPLQRLCGIIRRTGREWQSPVWLEVLWCYGSAWLVGRIGPPTIPAGLRKHSGLAGPIALLKHGGRAKYTAPQRCEYMLLWGVRMIGFGVVGIADIAPHGDAEQFAAEVIFHRGAQDLFAVVKVLGTDEAHHRVHKKGLQMTRHRVGARFAGLLIDAPMRVG
jgi:hypothetical protein